MEKKKGNWILIAVLASPIIIALIIAGAYDFCLKSDEVISLIMTSLSVFATILLGYMVFFQAENHKKRQEEDALIKEQQAQKNRDLDLMIRANPVVYLSEIGRFEYSSIIAGITLNEAKNNLVDSDSKDKLNFYNNHFSFDLLFDNPFGKMLDYITIKKATLSCIRGQFFDDEYEQKFKHSFENHSEKQAIIKIAQKGQSIALLQLYTNQIKENEIDIESLLNDTELKWSLLIEYTLSNSCGVYVDFSSQIKFSVCSPIKNEFETNIQCCNQETVTWQRSGVQISK